MAVWFLFILIAGEARHKWSSFILSISWCIYSYIMYFSLFEGTETTFQMGILICIDGATALALTAFFFRDETALKQSIILCFAVACHVVISWTYTKGSSSRIDFVINNYSELIIAVCLLQLVVSFDGLNRALHNIQAVLRWIVIYSDGVRKSLLSFKEKEKKS